MIRYICPKCKRVLRSDKYASQKDTIGNEQTIRCIMCNRDWLSTQLYYMDEDGTLGNDELNILRVGASPVSDSFPEISSLDRVFKVCDLHSEWKWVEKSGNQGIIRYWNYAALLGYLLFAFFLLGSGVLLSSEAVRSLCGFRVNPTIDSSLLGIGLFLLIPGVLSLFFAIISLRSVWISVSPRYLIIKTSFLGRGREMCFERSRYSTSVQFNPAKSSQLQIISDDGRCYNINTFADFDLDKVCSVIQVLLKANLE